MLKFQSNLTCKLKVQPYYGVDHIFMLTSVILHYQVCEAIY